MTRLTTPGSTTSAIGSSNSMTSTPSKTSVGGQSFVRTKSGNLISVDLVKKRELEAKRKRLDDLLGVVKNVQKARSAGTSTPTGVPGKGKTANKTLCRYFQRTGKCTRGLTCPYVHDSSKVAICPRFLRHKCTLTATSCPLSHTPNAHRMPHCVHFPNCRNGVDCPYAHVHVSPNAKVCKDFVTLGWCERGLHCKERHVWECPEFSEKGTCSNKACKLPHVIRRIDNSAVTDTSAGEPEESSDQEVASILLGRPPSRSRKRSISSANEDDAVADDPAADSEGREERKKLRFDPMKANEDFITLILSDSEDDDSDDDGDEEDEDTASSVVSDDMHIEYEDAEDSDEGESQDERADGDETLLAGAEEESELRDF